MKHKYALCDIANSSQNKHTLSGKHQTSKFTQTTKIKPITCKVYQKVSKSKLLNRQKPVRKLAKFLAPYQRNFNIDPPGLSRYYYYTSVVNAKCQKTFAKLDLQISAELPNTKPLFFAKITFLREHGLVPRQRSCNINPPGLS